MSGAVGSRLRRRRVAAGGRERGSVTLLSVAFAALALALVTAVVSATAVHLDHKRLVALADELALAAADALDVEAFYRGQAPRPAPDGVVPVTDAAVRRAVEEHLAARPGVGELEGLRVLAAGTDDGRTARVTLTAVTRPPLVGWVTAPWSGGIVLTATSSARAW